MNLRRIVEMLGTLVVTIFTTVLIIRALYGNPLSLLYCVHTRRKLLKFVWRTMRLYHKSLAAKSKALTGHFSRYDCLFPYS